MVCFDLKCYFDLGWILGNNLNDPSKTNFFFRWMNELKSRSNAYLEFRVLLLQIGDPLFPLLSAPLCGLSVLLAGQTVPGVVLTQPTTQISHAGHQRGRKQQHIICIRYHHVMRFHYNAHPSLVSNQSANIFGDYHLSHITRNNRSLH